MSEPENQAPAPAAPEGDVNMTDAAPAADHPATTTTAPSSQPAPAAESTPAQSPAPPTPVKKETTTGTGTPTPLRQEQLQGGSSSRAQSALPEQAPAIPAQASAHGAPVRQYLNLHVTNAVLEGMKLVAKERPKDPLRVLGEFLIQKSNEAEAGKSN